MFSIAIGSSPAHAVSADEEPLIDYPNFSGASKTLDRNGTADIITSSGHLRQRILRLSAGGFRQAGSAWDKQKIDLTDSFSSTFKVYLHHGQPGADGIAFLVQSEGPRALGGWGGGLGYRGIKKSVAVEFDTFQNTPDPNSNHLAVALNGDPDHHHSIGNPSIPLFGKPFVARVTYDADTNEIRVYVQALSAGATEQLALSDRVDLAASVRDVEAWVGFTAATGSALSKQDIYSWSLWGTEP